VHLLGVLLGVGAGALGHANVTPVLQGLLLGLLTLDDPGVIDVSGNPVDLDAPSGVVDLTEHPLDVSLVRLPPGGELLVGALVPLGRLADERIELRTRHRHVSLAVRLVGLPPRLGEDEERAIGSAVLGVIDAVVRLGLQELTDEPQHARVGRFELGKPQSQHVVRAGPLDGTESVRRADGACNGLRRHPLTGPFLFHRMLKTEAYIIVKNLTHVNTTFIHRPEV
jgi:hypothetical protein